VWYIIVNSILSKTLLRYLVTRGISSISRLQTCNLHEIPRAPRTPGSIPRFKARPCHRSSCASGAHARDDNVIDRDARSREATPSGFGSRFRLRAKDRRSSSVIFRVMFDLVTPLDRVSSSSRTYPGSFRAAYPFPSPPPPPVVPPTGRGNRLPIGATIREIDPRGPEKRKRLPASCA